MDIFLGFSLGEISSQVMYEYKCMLDNLLKHFKGAEYSRERPFSYNLRPMPQASSERSRILLT